MDFRSIYKKSKLLDVPDVEMNILKYLPVKDVLELSSTSRYHTDVISQNCIWYQLYQRDFHNPIPPSTLNTPKDTYHFRAINCFSHAEREKSINNMLNAMQQAQKCVTPKQLNCWYGIWKIEFDRRPGYCFLEDNKGLHIELAIGSNGWFRYKDYMNNELCVYSSAEVVNQALNVTSPLETDQFELFEEDTIYKWGEWSIICNIGYIYIMNNTDVHQALLLSPVENGFIFFPTDRNPSNMNNTIKYPRKE